VWAIADAPLNGQTELISVQMHCECQNVLSMNWKALHHEWHSQRIDLFAAELYRYLNFTKSPDLRRKVA
jgi:hypothetical protein